MVKSKTQEQVETFQHFEGLSIGGDENLQEQFEELEKLGNRFNVIRSIDDTLAEYSGKIQKALSQEHTDTKNASKPIYSNYYIVKNGKFYNLSIDDDICSTKGKAWKGIRTENFIKFYDEKPTKRQFGETYSDNVKATLELRVSKTSGNVYGYLKKGRNISVEQENMLVCMSEKKDQPGNFYSWLMLPDYHDIPYSER